MKLSLREAVPGCKCRAYDVGTDVAYFARVDLASCDRGHQTGHQLEIHEYLFRKLLRVDRV